MFTPKKGFEEKYGKLIFKDILRGIMACHKEGICHADIKLNNILLDKNFLPEISDFGLAYKKNDTILSQNYWGTEDYISLELLKIKP